MTNRTTKSTGPLVLGIALCLVGGGAAMLAFGALPALKTTPPPGPRVDVAANMGAGHDHGSHEAEETVRDPNRLWCAEHGVYEDECTACHPELADDRHDEEESHAGHDHGAGHSERNGVLWCNEHNVAESECGICRPQLLAQLPTGKGLKVRLASDVSLAKAGVQTGRPTAADGAVTEDVLGTIMFNRNQLAIVTPLGAGVLSEVLADVGERVDAGQLLASVNAPAIVEGKTAYLKVLAEAELRHQTYTREKDLYERGISARQDFQKAQADLSAIQSEGEHARRHLINLGLTEAEVDAVASTRATSPRLPIRAPFAGTVVERNAVLGTAVEPGTPLFKVAELSSMWMVLSIPESRLGAVAPGGAIEASFAAYPGRSFQGTLAWVAYHVDERTRMVEARAVLPNPDGLLRDGMFGRVSLFAGPQTPALTVPENAVQVVDGRPVLFAKLEEDLFETRLVEIGPARAGRVAVTAGLSAEDEVALEGSYILKSEFLKARLGAGCADH